MHTRRKNIQKNIYGSLWPARPYLGVQILGRSSVKTPKSIIKCCTTMFLNYAEQQIITYHQVWWATRESIRDIYGKVLLQVSLDLSCSMHWLWVLHEHDIRRVIVFTSPHCIKGIVYEKKIVYGPIFLKMCTYVENWTEKLFCAIKFFDLGLSFWENR